MQRYAGISLLFAACMSLDIAPRFASAATITQSFNYGAPAPCGTTLSCTTFEFGLVGGACTLSTKFIDGTTPALPDGAIVTQVTVRIHGYRSGGGITVTPIVQGEAVDSETDTLPASPSCDCEQAPQCAYTDFLSSTYPNGWPGWNYVEPDANELDLQVTGADGGIAVESVDVFITYRLCNNGIVETGEACDDADVDFCNGCTPTCEASPICDDDNVCTSDSCTPATGECVFKSEPCTMLDDGFEAGDLSAQLPAVCPPGL